MSSDFGFFLLLLVGGIAVLSWIGLARSLVILLSIGGLAAFMFWSDSYWLGPLLVLLGLIGGLTAVASEEEGVRLCSERTYTDKDA